MARDAMSGDALISWSLTCYNQAAFVADAVRSALAQRYSPLEIIISDDHSTDGTYEIARDLAQAYRGPHRVVVNQHPRNLGLGANFNWIFSQAQGAVVVAAAGDDISMPERAESVARLFLQQRPEVMAAFSDVVVIDEEGRTIQSELAREISYPPSLEDHLAVPPGHGATAAYRRSLFADFGPLRTDINAEDKMMYFRACLCGPVARIAEPLVHYRRHTGNYRHRHGRVNSYERNLIKCREMLVMLQQHAADLDAHSARQQPPSGRNPSLRDHLQRKIREQEALLQICTGTPGGGLRALRDLAACRGRLGRGIRLYFIARIYRKRP